MTKFATVDDMIKMLQKASEEGYGDYELECNYEYAVAQVGEVPYVLEEAKVLGYGGYC